MKAQTQYTAARVLNTLRGITMVAPEEVFVALFVGEPCGEPCQNEVEDPGYERATILGPCTMTIANAWTMPEVVEPEYEGQEPLPTDMFIENTQRMLFGPLENEAVTVTHFGIFDAKEDGNLLYVGQFDEPRFIDVDEMASVNPGGIRVIY